MQLGDHLHAVCRVSEQTRNEIRHVVDLCNDHAPIRQVRTAQARQPPQQAAPQPQQLTRQQQQQQQHAQQQSRQQQQRGPQAQPSPQQIQQHRQVAAAAAAAAAASAQRAQAQAQPQPLFHSPDMQRLLAFGQRESPQQGYRIASA